MDIENIRPQELICQYLLEMKGKGTILAYSDHEIVEAWLAAAPTVDDLLVILAELAPPYMARNPQPRSLAGLRKRVLDRLAGIR